MGEQELKDILEKHRKWVRSEEGGVRASLDGASLNGANLTRANLDGASLNGANLTRANLDGANLYGVRTDFFAKLAKAKAEVPGLYDALIRGRVDGSCYEGECACFVGTIANVRGEKYDDLTNGLEPESESATERWFLAIRKGDVPSSNQVAEITRKWIEEFATENGIALPKYRLVSSAEFPAAF